MSDTYKFAFEKGILTGKAIPSLQLHESRPGHWDYSEPPTPFATSAKCRTQASGEVDGGDRTAQRRKSLPLAVILPACLGTPQPCVSLSGDEVLIKKRRKAPVSKGTGCAGTYSIGSLVGLTHKGYHGRA